MQVLFLQGGASTAFANVPLNLTKAGDSVDQIVTGSWSKKAAEEAKKYCKVNVAAKGDNKHIPEQKSWKLQKQAKYVHYCDNETIQVHLQLFLAGVAAFLLHSMLFDVKHTLLAECSLTTLHCCDSSMLTLYVSGPGR